MRYLNLGYVSAPWSQSVYHALAERLKPGDPVTLVTVSPQTPYVCVGYHQVASREIDRAYCESEGILVGRRKVGGGAVWLDEDQIFWHLLLPGSSLSVEALYRSMLVAPVRAYRRLGISAEHRPVNDLVVGPRKIGGTGAATIGQTLVLVGSLMMDFDVQQMSRVLKVPSEKFRDKLVQSLEDYMTTVRRELGDRMPSREEATRVLVESFAEVLNEPIEPDQLSPDEWLAVRQEADALFDPAFVYRDEGWIQPGVKIRDGVRLWEGVTKAPGGLIRAIWREADGRFDDVVLSGDFFIEPPETLEVFRRTLLGRPANAEEAAGCWDQVASHALTPGLTRDHVLAAFSTKSPLVVT
ncbi:biotin/lipoate A/B protein ligase [Sulfobacillus acidophilus TPY]|uniref:Biotin/lipoate A/B protein ligase n=1 Tax=Sulfobacillus acidophilus (strain ATCC 700253 / DSM 10332 / NAL) TaxID=679936 RepID=G8TWJ0_SULAD|nr:biotin/lipoate A/B protein ligase [Sulfobacillus acidophilus TPY]AEW04888.1 biotin/lipoate A/B protein ligase [Sulfobacillus acidophilus DSM 10332]